MVGTPIRVREFAEKCGCSPQNVYLHLKNHAEELEGHLLKDRRGTLLDDYAQDFIRQAMYPKELSADNSVQKLEEQVAELRTALFTAGQENLKLSSKLLETEGERDRALLDAGQYQKLLKASEEAEEAKERELEDLRKDAQKTKERLLRYNEEVAAYNKLSGLRRLFTKAPVLQEE